MAGKFSQHRLMLLTLEKTVEQALVILWINSVNSEFRNPYSEVDFIWWFN